MIRVEETKKEMALAFLADLPFTGFEETAEGWKAYLGKELPSESWREELDRLARRIPFQYELSEIPEENWNRQWESHFDPIRVEGFCWVRAPFHPENKSVPYQITISPRMAFGTGHHATTYLMMSAMEDLDWKGSMVLDFGCGTGILAILAHQMGAQYVEGLDISEEAIENSRENASLNGVSLHLREGGLEEAQRSDYDFILANITRNVILGHLDALYNLVKEKGHILFSGVLQSDEELLINSLQAAGLRQLGIYHREGWVCVHVQKV